MTAKIALFGVFGVGNLGNDGSLEAMLNAIRQFMPGAEVFCICTVPERVREKFGIQSISIDTSPGYGWFARRSARPALFWRALLKLPREGLRWLRKYRRLRGVDMLIIPGTGILDDFGENPFGTPYELAIWCIVAKLRRVKVKFVSVGAGPIHNRLSLVFARAALWVADYRSFRDELSKQFAQSIGIAVHNDRVEPDLVFGLPRPVPVPRPDKGDSLVVGLGVMAYFGWSNRPDIGGPIYDSYIRRIAEFASWLLDRGCSVRLLIGESVDQRAVNDVKSIVGSTADENGRERLVVNERIDSLQELMEEIAYTDVVVATRYHNVVCALMMSKPVVSCGYARKNYVLLADMGLESFCQEIDQLDVQRLKEQFDELVARRGALEAQIAERNSEYRKKLAEQYRVIFADA